MATPTSTAVSSPPTSQASRTPLVGLSLTAGRRVLWQGNPATCVRWFLNPLRLYVVDPLLAIHSVLLPLVLPVSLDPVMAMIVDALLIPLLKRLYCVQTTAPEDVLDGNVGGERDDVARMAKSSILHHPTVVRIERPTDLQSSFIGAVSFIISAIGDVAGILTNPKKFQGWLEALSQFNTFLETTGMAAEMQEAIQKPLLSGRLLDNFKILNDIQELHYLDRVTKARDQNEDGLIDDIARGHRLMRFATAAYGTEMIRSAVDKDHDAATFLKAPVHAIALHTQLSEADIQFIYCGNDRDEHILHHFVALKHDEKAVVLAIRGTLSLSGAIADVQGMAVDYCTGKAHKGISEMARNVWKESGEKIVSLMEQYSDYKLIVTGHSLGAGASCLLTVQLYVDQSLPERTIECFAFAPPPTFSYDTSSANCVRIQRAFQNTVAFVHDNDVVPFLSVSAVRRMIKLLDTVDNETEFMWFWKRWRIFYEYDPIPEELVSKVLQAERDAVVKDHLIIPCRRVVWIHHKDGFQAYSCDANKVAEGNIFLCPDMLSDHLPEQYETSLDALHLA